VSDTARCVAITVALALTAASAAQAAPPPAGWRKASDRNGRCAAYLPSDWHAGAIKGTFESPSKALAVITNNTTAQSVADVKALVTQTLKPIKTFEDGASRLWYEYEGNAGTGPTGTPPCQPRAARA
jgi:hypothetical protein